MRPDLLSALRRELKAAADPGLAPQMQTYMKSAMLYHGVPLPKMRQICRSVFADVDLPSAKAWRSAVLSIWRRASQREERYAAIELTEIKRFAPFQTMDALPMYEEMIVKGAWWDYVDAIATHRLGFLLRRYPAVMRRKMLAWSRSKDMWKRRSAILCQIQFKKDTDLVCSTPASSRVSLRASSSSARRSAGRCVSTPGRIRGRFADTLPRAGPPSRICPNGKR